MGVSTTITTPSMIHARLNAHPVLSEKHNRELKHIRKEKKNYAGSKLPASTKEMPKCRESPPPKEKRKLVGIWRVAGSPLLQTETLRAVSLFKCTSL